MEQQGGHAYRMRRESVVFGLVGLCFVVLGVGGALSASGDLLGLGLVRLIAAWTVAAFFVLRMARLGVFVERDGIRVRNPLKTVSIPWSQVRGFALRRSALGEFGIADLHGGRRVRLWGIQPRAGFTSSRDRRAELAIGHLNRDLQRARGSGWPGAEPS
jgi:Bacterial PH domain